MTPSALIAAGTTLILAYLTLVLALASMAPSVARTLMSFHFSDLGAQWHDMRTDIRSRFSRGSHAAAALPRLAPAPVVAMHPGEPATVVTDEHRGATEDWSPKQELQQVSARRAAVDVHPSVTPLDDEASAILNQLADVCDAATSWVDEAWLAFLDRVDESLENVSPHTAEAHRRWRAQALHFDTAEYQMLTAA